jgi:DNA-binding transcriptional regulator LsrR (DeoR family)
MGPEELVRVAFVATRFHIDGKSRVEIADELGVSRFKVARMLEAAHASGMVTVTVSTPGPIDTDLSMRLKDAFGLTRALVVTTPLETPDVIQLYLGRVAATLLREVVRAGDVVGLTAGRTLGVMARQLTSIAPCDVVQLAGVAGSIQSTAVEVIRRVSQVAGGEAFTMFAPLVTSDPESAVAIRRQHDVGRTLAQLERVTVAMTAIGSWDPADSQMFDNPAISAERRERLLARGVQADLGAVVVTARGEVVDDIDDLCIGATAEDLRRIPDVIGVAGGERKTAAILAALRSELIGSLVTDASTARRLLES